MQLSTSATILCLVLGREGASSHTAAPQPPTVASVFVEGCSSLPVSTIRGLLRTRPGTALHQKGLEDDRDAVLHRYHEAGHLLATVASEVVLAAGDRALVTFRVTEGPSVNVSDVEVTGNEGVTRSEVMAALGLGPPGLLGFIDPGHYRPSAVREGLEKLRRL